MTRPVKEVLWNDHPDVSEGRALEFRLTYSGPLKPDTSDQVKRATHKHELRKYFHPQLKALWAHRPHLNDDYAPLPPHALEVDYEERREWKGRIHRLAHRFARNGYHPVPLVTEDLNLLCSIDVLFLRYGAPGKVLENGDIDNRIKTLFDGLKMWKDADQLGEYQRPDADEDPFFCLLENDSLITSMTVETDVMFQPVSAPGTRERDAQFDARLIIKVKLTPVRLNFENMLFA